MPDVTAPRSTLLVIPRRGVSANDVLRMHWTERRRAAIVWGWETFTLWFNAGKPRYERAIVTVRYVFPEHRQRDTDNWTGGSTKWLLDGLKHDAFPDDDSEHLTLRPVELVVEPGCEPRVEVRIEGAE
jgi:hypothetical protein